MGTKIVFDIETVGVDFETLDKDSQESVLKYAKTEEEVTAAKESLVFSPTTGKIITIGLVDVKTDEGVVFFESKDGKTKNFKDEKTQYIVCNEKEILENFWDRILKYDQFVTFNGRGFDCPYVILRSAVHKVKPTRDLMPYRFDVKNHIDLYDQLTFYGAMRKNMSLHMITQAMGIKSPKKVSAVQWSAICLSKIRLMILRVTVCVMCGQQNNYICFGKNI